MKFYGFLYCLRLVERISDSQWRDRVSPYSSSTEALCLCVCMSDPKDAYARTPLELRINFISIIQNLKNTLSNYIMSLIEKYRHAESQSDPLGTNSGIKCWVHFFLFVIPNGVRNLDLHIESKNKISRCYLPDCALSGWRISK